MQLREATPADADDVAALHTASWRDAYRTILSPDYLAGPIEAERQAIWRPRLAEPRPDQRVTLAVADGALAGFVCAFGHDDPRWGALVDNLHVARSTRGTGLGARLLREAGTWVADTYPGSSLFLWVYEANLPARGFYDRMGGQVVERLVKSNPGGGEAARLRIHWPDPRSIGGLA